MNPINVTEEIGAALGEIWNNPDFKHLQPQYQGKPLLPLYPEFLPENALIFVGLNPSFKELDHGLTSYPIAQRGNLLAYYKSCERLAEEVDHAIQWGHLDLLFVRHSKAQYMKDLAYRHKGGRSRFRHAATPSSG